MTQYGLFGWQSDGRQECRPYGFCIRDNNDPIASQTIERLTRFFGVALSVVINILDPDVIVIGGGVGNIDVIYTEGLISLQKNIFNHRLDTPVLRPKLGDSAGVFGAAFLVN